MQLQLTECTRTHDIHNCDSDIHQCEDLTKDPPCNLSVMWTHSPISTLDHPTSQYSGPSHLSIMWTLTPVSTVDPHTCQQCGHSHQSVQWTLPSVNNVDLPPVSTVDPHTCQQCGHSHLLVQWTLTGVNVDPPSCQYNPPFSLPAPPSHIDSPEFVVTTRDL